MSSTAKSAVSDYEHLRHRFGDENQIGLNESEDEDFLPLKSRVKLKGCPNGADSNQNNCVSSSSKSILENGFDSIERVPVPSAWSPGMIIKPNPSLLVTPEKLSKGPDKDNILEPRDLNKVPAPVAWSPGLEPRPSVFITPEKTLGGELTSHKPALQTTDTTKTKEKLSVRFDLPSSSSGDEFLDSSAFSSSHSPITIKGKEFEEREKVLIDSSCPSKVYNPMVYSDDSVLDDSISGGKEALDSDAVSLSTSANLVEKLNQLLISSQVHKDQNFTQSANCMNNTSQKDSSDSQTNLSSFKAKSTLSSHQSAIRKSSSSSNIKKSSSFNPVNKSSKHPIHTHHTKENKSGHHHLSSSGSPYYPPNSGACVVREAKHPMVSTDYSYPFQNADGNQEHEHIFSRPEFNSTLKVRSELDNLCDRDVDVQKAVEVKLSKSSTKQAEIHEKAAVFTNQLSDQFTNLVDLEPVVDRLCDRVVRMRTSKVTTQKKGYKQQKKTSCHKEPDLMEFYHSDLQKESPDLGLLGISPAVPDLIDAPQDQAFDCYRHYRVWNGLRDF